MHSLRWEKNFPSLTEHTIAILTVDCCLDANLSGEAMAMKSLKKINTKLRFLYRQNDFLNSKLSRLLHYSIIQPHLDYACIS